MVNVSLGDDPNGNPEASDFLATLLRDATSSHLLETLVAKSSVPIFNLLWSTYFQRQLPRLSTHPVANFVVACALARVDRAQLDGVFEELEKSWQKIISMVPNLFSLVGRSLTCAFVESSRVGVVKALVDRAVTLRSHEGDIVEVCCPSMSFQMPFSSFSPGCVLRF